MVKEAAVPTTRQTSIEEAKMPKMGNVAVKCPKCKEIAYTRDWEKNLKICAKCGYHFNIT